MIVDQEADQNQEPLPRFVFSRLKEVPLNSYKPLELFESKEPQETPTVIDPIFLPENRAEYLAWKKAPLESARKPGDIAQALLKENSPSPIKDNDGSATVQGLDLEFARTVATENSPESKRSMQAASPQKMVWL